MEFGDQSRNYASIFIVLHLAFIFFSHFGFGEARMLRIEGKDGQGGILDRTPFLGQLW